MDWNWVISRQREFATPIPAWHCANEGYEHTDIASEAELPGPSGPHRPGQRYSASWLAAATPVNSKRAPPSIPSAMSIAQSWARAISPTTAAASPGTSAT